MEFRIYCEYLLEAKDEQEAEQIIAEESDFIGSHIIIEPKQKSLTTHRNKLNRQIATLKKANLKEKSICINCENEAVEGFEFCSNLCQEEAYLHAKQTNQI